MNRSAGNGIDIKTMIIIYFAMTIILAAVIFVGYKFLKHEQNQDTRISLLEEKILKLNADMSSSKFKGGWLIDGYNYLAIGNSLTIHGTGSYWWNEVGMAASDIDHDYFHIVSSFLKTVNPKFMSIPYNFSVWETLSHDRDETLCYLDHYLDTKLNLITVQLGENVSDFTTYEEDFESLLGYLKEKAPKARILVIGDFWSKNNRNDLKIKAIESIGAEYVSLDGITDNKDYCCGLGTVVYDSEGKEHIVEHSGVANHPGDKGMRAIADRIIDALNL